MKTAEWKILLGSGEWPLNITRRVIGLRLVDERGIESDSLEVELDDRDGRLAIPRHGEWLNVWIGWRGVGLWDKGRYIVDEVEHSGPPDVLRIRARSAALRATLKEQRSESYEDLRLDELAAIIAARHGLDLVVGQDIAPRLVNHIDQRDESDVHFLTRVAREHDAMATVKHGRLLLMCNGEGVAASGAPLERVIIRRGDGDSHRYTSQDRAGTTTGVRATWRDRLEAEDKVVVVGDDQNTKALRRIYPSRAEAERAAGAELRRTGRAARTLSITLAYGRHELSAETPISLVDFKPGIDGDWIASRVEHQVSSTGFVTHVDMEPESISPPAARDIDNQGRLVTGSGGGGSADDAPATQVDGTYRRSGAGCYDEDSRVACMRHQIAVLAHGTQTSVQLAMKLDTLVCRSITHILHTYAQTAQRELMLSATAPVDISVSLCGEGRAGADGTARPGHPMRILIPAGARASIRIGLANGATSGANVDVSVA